jgi:hypothetical protein
MNLTLGTLEELKIHLLNAALRSSTDYDATIAALGRGVAARFENYCNRKFLRTIGDTFECTADRMHVTLPRYPVEASPTIEQRDDLATGFVAQTYTDLVFDEDLPAGLIKFAAFPGPYISRLRFTYTGGYWFSDTGADSGTPSAVQSGTVSLNLNDELVAITFATPYNSPPVVVPTVVLPVGGGSPISANAYAITTTGCLVQLGAAVPGAGYSLAWQAEGGIPGISTPATQPVGATARPDDLYLAWLLQCERIWAVRDNLGVNIAGEKNIAFVSSTLAALELVPEVENTLRNYRRYSMT